jgi:hypothetical protein
MINHRLTRTAAIALAIAATTAPAAAARSADGPAPAKHWTLPHDFQTADARDATRGIYEPLRPEDQPEPAQDLRSADTRDYAEGRGTYNAPAVVVVDAPEPVAPPTTAGGLDWMDVGIGAGGLLGAALIGLGGALAIVHRRGARELA